MASNIPQLPEFCQPPRCVQLIAAALICFADHPCRIPPRRFLDLWSALFPVRFPVGGVPLPADPVATSRIFPRVRPCSDLRCPEVPESWLPWAYFASSSPRCLGLQTHSCAVLLLMPAACKGLGRSAVHVLRSTCRWSESSRTQLPPLDVRPSHKGSVGYRLASSAPPLRVGVLYLFSSGPLLPHG
jgi:hypothetical protein